MTTTTLDSAEFDPYYGRYIGLLDCKLDLREGFTTGLETTTTFFKSIPDDRLDFRYEEGKWTIKEVLQHLIDTERIFIYRCFRIARRDITALAAFDQNIYTLPSGAGQKTFDQLLGEYTVGRRNSISILNSLSDDDLSYVGNANGAAMSARAAAFTIIGHDIWHMDIIKERYLQGT
ncbi:MAG: DinB family protein [Bacteroidota bacterium]